VKFIKKQSSANQEKKIKVLKFLKRKALKKKQKSKSNTKSRKYKMPLASSFRFRRLETLIKNKHAQMKHWNLAKARDQNPKYGKLLYKQLNGIQVILILRIHSERNLPLPIIKILEALQLKRNFSCIIARNTPELRHRLRKILPFITFGIPTQELIRDLVMKRGTIYNKQKKQRIVIKSNGVIEECLGKYNIVCIEDIIDILSNQNALTSYNLQENERSRRQRKQAKKQEEEEKNNNNDISYVKKFDMVSKIICPFYLNSMKIPMYGLQGSFDHKGYWGFRGQHINTFVEKLI